MAKFAFIYHGGSAPSSPEEGEEIMAAWVAWMGLIGENLVDGGNPFGRSQIVNSDGSVAGDGGANPASGYSMIDVADGDATAEIAKTCPILEAGGSVEICPAMEM